MRCTVPHRSTLVTLGVLLVGLLGSPVSTRAESGTVSNVPGTTTTTASTLFGTTTILFVDTGTLAAGTSDALDASALPVVIPGLLTTGVLHATTIGSPGQIDSEASLADLALSVAGFTLRVDFVMARAVEVFGAAGAGVAEIDNLWINGMPILVTGAPNQRVNIIVGVVILNEQQTLSDGTIVVNAIHMIIPGVVDVVIASATAGASGGRATVVKASY